MRIALAQLDSRLDALDGNVSRACEAVAKAGADSADLIVFPELQLSGYGSTAVDHDTSRTVEEAAAVADRTPPLPEVGHDLYPRTRRRRPAHE